MTRRYVLGVIIAILLILSMCSCLRFKPLEPWPEDGWVPCQMRPGCR